MSDLQELGRVSGTGSPPAAAARANALNFIKPEDWNPWRRQVWRAALLLVLVVVIGIWAVTRK